ncbi:glycosyl transferase family 2 [Flavobacterium columnare NBRC 100251 = ATCC 23463]|uniref:Glycosyl transferase, group 2 family protein n=2 Tax=Flavobacterium columnare TaxID=996 RepID=G8X8Y9_FLACA|nr:glycosyltransferase family 2 protein [Flavobacterium columnare]AEW87222.1 glycosyl transferase, group 2 family protein [Flavobacterium columnare ATCC 49512]AMO19124.1 glycosyltransferase [Flavobacterium columnare]ANO48065.1 glycosyl transferase, group 2 family protein [Flavobacterium columnare]APT21362.1 glycosyl transferase family 2 [Flavobacterium columnare]AUX17066.1 glycosyl transferase family 2 [Flavobacterium columnare]
MQLSVIILNYNVCYFLEQCLLSVQKALEGIDGEIIVVDNFSKDNSCTMMKQRFPKVKLIENKKNLGFPKGNNIGVAEAIGEYICILNPDTVVAEDTFKKIFDKVVQASSLGIEKLGIIGCKLIDGTGNFLPECKRGLPTPWVACTKILGLYKIFPNIKWFNQYYAQHLNENQSGEVDVLVGAFMIIKRDVYLKVGGFDEGCFMYSDDIDLSYLIQKEGFQNYYYHETTVIHYKGESTLRDEKYIKHFSDAMQFFYNKHFGRAFLFKILMKGGTIAFALFKSKQQKQISSIIDEYILYTRSKELYKNFSNTFEKKCTQQNDINENPLFSRSYLTKNRVEIVLDNNSFSFKEIITFLEKNKNSGFSFKILPMNSDFILGSNSSYDKGEVLLLK